MQLSYESKATLHDVLAATPEANLTEALLVGRDASTKNLLIRGENLRVMQALRRSVGMTGRVDLVYIDPPFSTNTVFKHGEQRTSHVSSSDADAVAYRDALRGAEYIEFIRERLILIRELMANHASIYLHIDYKIGHYVKIIMDEVFGQRNFRNDITRVKCNPKNFARKGYSNIKDMILFYTKGDTFRWHEPMAPVSEDDVQRLFGKRDVKGRLYTTTPLHAPGETRNGDTGKRWRGLMPPKGRHWRYPPAVLDELDAKGLIEWSRTGNPRKIIYAEDVKKKGKRLQDIWTFKDEPYPSYPTEKNLDLLKLIVATSSDVGDTVLDCFCGSGTTLLAAHELGRNWLGIDESQTAISVCRKRLKSISRTLFAAPPSYKHCGETIHLSHRPGTAARIASG